MEKEEVVIRHADMSDEDNIIEFIRENWYIRNHVFTRRKDVFEDCHVVDGKLNFIIGEGKISKKLYGVCGYVLCNRSENPDINSVIYQTIKSGNTMLGIDLVLELRKMTNCRVLSSPGMREKTKVIYEFLGYATGKLQHYYRTADLADYKVAKIVNKKIRPVTENKYKLELLENVDAVRKRIDLEKFKHIKPYKDNWCVEHRYYQNIGYSYHVYGIIDENNSCSSLLVGREIDCNERRIFKIIDFIGNDEDLKYCSGAIQKLIEDREYEYVDFYEYGIDDKIMEAAGFTRVEENDENIIPQYFEPYEQKNIEILFFTTDLEGYHAYRTDSGQDRPNFIENT